MVHISSMKITSSNHNDIISIWQVVIAIL